MLGELQAPFVERVAGVHHSDPDFELSEDIKKAWTFVDFRMKQASPQDILWGESLTTSFSVPKGMNSKE